MTETNTLFSKILLGSLLLVTFFCLPVNANNIQIDNFSVYEISSDTNLMTFEVDLSWDNSWKTTINNDALWVFMKYSTDAGKTWNHASMSASGKNPTSFFIPSNFEVIVPEDETGFFLQRTDLNSGNVSAEDLRFIWDYAQDGLSDAQAASSMTINKVYALEMVYIPEGSFFAGDGNSSSDYRFMQGSADTDPWYIQSEDAINVQNVTTNGYYYTSTGQTGEDASGSSFILSSSFPKGYDDFYLMKYELTEGQWVEFFNTLSNEEKVNRDITSASEGGKNSDAVVTRNTIAWDNSTPNSNATTQRPDRPVSYISWPDLLAYADWAGLRPVTELEFEKAARGRDVAPVINEFAWGKSTYNAAGATAIYPDADESGAETIFDSSANINRNQLGWSSGDGRVGGSAQGQAGPLRTGIFAESSTTRSTSGAGYYGNMELSGNLAEMIVSIGRSQGRSFLGSHGDGQLTTAGSYEGNATNADWPGINSFIDRGVTDTVGSGFRGGDYQSSTLRYYQISSRINAVRDPDSLGYNQRYDASLGIFQGGRLGRTAP